jgi:hypothetical protein
VSERPTDPRWWSFAWNSTSRRPRLTFTFEIWQDGESRLLRRAMGLDRTCSRFGRWQWWFFCPRCGRHCSSLYLPPDAADFAWRRCHRLLYLS